MINKKEAVPPKHKPPTDGPENKNRLKRKLQTVEAELAFVGIAVIKTLIEVAMYQFPLQLKFASNFAAFVIDAIAFVIGIVLNKKIKIVR